MPKKKILVIDDAPDTVAFLSAWLKDHGFEICSASDGNTGFTTILREKPDLILMDVKMPGQTGSQLYRELKSTDIICKIPVIFVTGLSKFDLFGSDCEPLPKPEGHLEKPIDLDALSTLINTILYPG